MHYLTSFYGISSELRPKEVIALRLCHEIDVLPSLKATAQSGLYLPIGVLM